MAGTEVCPDPSVHGNPFRYCPYCDWKEEPMRLNPTELAQAAYRAYCGSVHGRSVNGEPLPEWDEMPERIRTAWEVAAEAVARKALGLNRAGRV